MADEEKTNSQLMQRGGQNDEVHSTEWNSTCCVINTQKTSSVRPARDLETPQSCTRMSSTWGPRDGARVSYLPPPSARVLSRLL